MEDMLQIRRLPLLRSLRAAGWVATRRRAAAWLTSGSLAAKCVATAWLATLFTVVLTSPANAAGSGMPWEAPLQRILESIEGPVAKVVAVVTIIITGLSLAFGDMGGGLRRLIQIVFGLSIAFAATSFFLSFFSFAGGAVIN
jgi:type IV secretion system protein VirB2